MEWCSHPVPRRESTKVGCKPSHPRGDRRMDGQLARFISEMYAMVNETNQYALMSTFVAGVMKKRMRSSMMLAHIKEICVEMAMQQ